LVWSRIFEAMGDSRIEATHKKFFRAWLSTRTNI
jgi:hypothetical protein